MKTTIFSKKLDQNLTFSRPGHAYIYVDINGQPGTSMQGGWIARSGLPLPRMNAETALWIILKAE